MIEGQTPPLEVAKRVLPLATLQTVARAPYTLQGWKILDRWALNSPQTLQALAQQGEVILLGRLLEQQNLETQVLQQHQNAQGMAEHEILALHQIQTELN